MLVVGVDDISSSPCMTLSECCHELIEVPTTEDALERLASQAIDVIVIALEDTPPTIDLCRRVSTIYPEVFTVVLAKRTSVETIVALMRAGAFDVLLEHADTREVEASVSRALEESVYTRKVTRLQAVAPSTSETGILGSSPSITATIELVKRVAACDASVTVVGESGSGKELVARALHDLSDRRDQPFIAVNCAAMPSALLESELFGHVKGAFTDAVRARPGLFVQARNGTILLDEIGDMPLEMQVKLLRALQERRVRPVGGDEETPFAARVVAATNRDLEQEVARGRFRADLFYRINVVMVRVPPLRDRGNDILELAQTFLVRAAARTAKPVRGISTAAARQLMSYAWPGNVRELENCIERALALCRLDEITVADLPPNVRSASYDGDPIPLTASQLFSLEEMERRYVRHVLAAVNGNKSHAARVLQIDRRSLYRRLELETEAVVRAALVQP